MALARVSSQLDLSSNLGCVARGSVISDPAPSGAHVGVLAGAEIEYQISRNWILGVEYNYMDFSTESYGGTISPNATWPLASRCIPRSDIVKGRLSFKL